MLSRFTPHQTGVLAVLAAAILWSTAGLLIKWLPFEPMTILFYRAVCAVILFGFLFGRSVFKLNLNTLIVSGFYMGLMVTFVFATKMTTAANAIFLQYTSPVYILLLEPVLFKTPLKRINVVTIIVCMVGMALFFIGDIRMGSMSGNVVALFSGISMAGMMLAQRKNAPNRHEAAIFWGNLLMVFLTFPAYLESPAPSIPEWGMLLFLGFVQIGLGYVFFTYGLKRILAIESALIAMLEPIINPIWVYLGYGEVPSVSALIGGGLIIAMLSIRTIVIERRKLKAQRKLEKLKT